MAPFTSYIICTSPRSGSTLLCKMLSDTGVAGHPNSYFHRPSLEAWMSDLGVDSSSHSSDRDRLETIFRAAIRAGSRETGMFGLRLQRHSFDFFMEQLALLYPQPQSDLARLQAAFGPVLFIHLTRLDKVEQAVSYVKAEQSGLWHKAADGSELERLAPPADPVYNGQEVAACHTRFTNFDRQWRLWFDAQAITPLHLTYEALAADPVGTLRFILERLGLDPAHAEKVTPGVAKLADAASAVWVERFRREVLAD
ncbi:Stf0 sulfotransferase family protein [Allorhizobium sp. BGMRC 0089]|uniref:Stf0 family sulfotransferase n=1 Tax=Allorhizobium sonneratiae TaxID=2934936 RepID=UPI002033A487|nr:Stf0 family sulfotransferase [Allorhizobium sonneratiae]MCM2291510.1 Stf0 sulfotransferase family protein [Allorhizobium sonneratiae]